MVWTVFSGLLLHGNYERDFNYILAIPKSDKLINVFNSLYLVITEQSLGYVRVVTVDVDLCPTIVAASIYE